MAKAKPILRKRTVSTKVTEEEFFGLEAQATERGVNLSEWVRETLLASVNGQEPRAATLLMTSSRWVTSALKLT